ncbi:MAG: hypothetical protein Fur0010_27040 [Bdellovibrio sp.]
MKLITAFMLFLSTTLFAQDFTRCVDSPEFRMRFKGSYFSLNKTNNGECWLSISPDGQWPVYRDFMFGDESWLMIFASLGDGPQGTDTGARMFSFFPRVQDLSFSLDENAQKVTILIPNGASMTFDLATHSIVSSTDMVMKDDGRVTRSNRGGLELTPLKGIVLDEGWRLGELPRIQLSRKSTFIDNAGNKCDVVNSKLFKLVYDNGGDVDGAVLKFVTDEDLRIFLNKDCPKISTDDL